MKDKIITIKPKNITKKQWVNFLLELNLMKKAWKPYGVDVTLKAHSIKKIIEKGTSNGELNRGTRQHSEKVQRHQR